MGAILKKWGYRERMSHVATSSRNERAIMMKISENHALRSSVHDEFERFMMLARDETSRMSAEVKKLLSQSMEAAAKLEALDHEEAQLMASVNIRPSNPSAAADAVAHAASGTSRPFTSPCMSQPCLTFGRLHGRNAIPLLQPIQRAHVPSGPSPTRPPNIRFGFLTCRSTQQTCRPRRILRCRLLARCARVFSRCDGVEWRRTGFFRRIRRCQHFSNAVHFGAVGG
jgi:hypothetical protein